MIESFGLGFSRKLQPRSLLQGTKTYFNNSQLHDAAVFFHYCVSVNLVVNFLVDSYHNQAGIQLWDCTIGCGI